MFVLPVICAVCDVCRYDMVVYVVCMASIRIVWMQ